MNNPHKNSRTSLYSREQIVLRHRRGETASHIVVSFGISVRAVHKWLKRHRDLGAAGLANRSLRPSSNPRAYLAAYDALIARFRTFRLTALDIAGALNLCRS